MTPFFIALQFLTTFPVQLKQMPSKQQNAQSLLFYPVIGLIIGLILFALAHLLQAIPVILLSSLILVLWIWLTGGLHLDGLADTADAWVGGFGDAERTLSIMKDPSCGPIGVLSLIILCLLKWSALYVLLQEHLYSALILFPLLGRLAPLFLFLTTPYVRQKGLGTSIAEFIPKTAALIVCALCLLASVYWGWAGIMSAIVMTASLLYLRHKFIQRIGGITGDTVGASIEICEAVSLLGFVVAIFYLTIT
ncbi:adenosylcobinamide-GDP ribazoletransferase [Acinetobacter sp. C_4_1]|uniref:adenosylcobinamide-GDP ribazoletransferase n=1 Tax=unclassified Acinetobacter TaxID=196816 RepID=UPI0021B80EBD|nr:MULTISPECIES: adenosylcobinamide-GDP ribazoletransferase [unclassified Acinetobacter]MCT8088079.1 adenosylcobinamide-GDP ribazoletransferase [Acinetobacter sp. F_3_1]MCT8097448.1 adenosylcobinamide-GDP ribazoletransferase [Acinetobacter sp. C_3_1]MCT8100541.1 adenosylcobinamide-GDP ribazoletransferase [Acinetobacter sp. C_4_1]MCT8134172.1 adenosylcobinamide-GDP ribazoletransferase [Acinetobacter sp. T_3_1]